jgi:sugar/nucleoside kinase (ribokinase family)
VFKVNIKDKTMSLLVTGSIGIDTVKTPFGTSEDCIGGSAIYFSLAASFFSPVRFLGVAGEDCPFDFDEIFKGRDVDLSGLEIRKGSKTFRWHGTYQPNMNDRTTDLVELNVLAETPPSVPESFRDSDFVFLANTAPALQTQLINQIDSPKLVVADTMDLWIDNEKDELFALLKKIDALVLNDSEAIQLSGHSNLVAAAKAILGMGLKFVLIKKGEHGAMLLTENNEVFVLPAYPTENVKDPTGAGDSFAGGFMGYLASCDSSEFIDLKKAIAYGTAVASLGIEDFSLNRWKTAGKVDIDKRFAELQEIMQF